MLLTSAFQLCPENRTIQCQESSSKMRVRIRFENRFKRTSKAVTVPVFRSKTVIENLLFDETHFVSKEARTLSITNCNGTRDGSAALCDPFHSKESQCLNDIFAKETLKNCQSKQSTTTIECFAEKSQYGILVR